MPLCPYAIRIDERDNVAVALSLLEIGQPIAAAGISFVARSVVPAGHKIALRPVRAGNLVVKFGHPIGVALRDIAAGDHVHEHNLGARPSSAARIPVMQPNSRSTSVLLESLPTFFGYVRPDGQIGTRNQIWIFALSGAAEHCARRVAALIAPTLPQGTDGVVPFSAFDSSPTQDHAARGFLRSLACHPNAGGVLVIGLHELDRDSFLADLPRDMRERLHVLGLQNAVDEVEEGRRLAGILAERAAGDRRMPCPLGKLVVGLKCGATDGLSGVTVNPLLGRFPI